VALQSLVAEEGIPELVREFIGRHVHSIEQLEILLLVANSGGRAWTATDVSSELRISPDSSESRLRQFVSDGLMRASGEGANTAFMFSPKGDRESHSVHLLGQCYRDRRVSIIELIFSRPSDTIQTFADAFKIKKP
jgi:hypothetical protein